MPAITVDEPQIRRFFEILFPLEDYRDERVMPHVIRIRTCYYKSMESKDEQVFEKLSNDHDAAVKFAVERSLKEETIAVWVTINPVDDGNWEEQKATGDDNISRRTAFFVDFDPKRPKGTNSTDSELADSLEAAIGCRDWLREQGFPKPLLCMSGNAHHLLYKTDLPTRDGGLIERFLEALAARFNNDKVEVDRGVHNPSRVCKIPGTMTRKGEDTPERPQRLAEILKDPKTRLFVPQDLLERVVGASAPSKPAPKANGASAVISTDRATEHPRVDITNRGLHTIQQEKAMDPHKGIELPSCDLGPDPYHDKPVSTEWGKLDVPNCLKTWVHTWMAYANFQAYGSDRDRDTLIYGCTRLIAYIARKTVEDYMGCSRRASQEMRECFHVGLAAAIMAMEDHTKFPTEPSGTKSETENENKVIGYYLGRAAKNAMLDYLDTLRIVHVPRSTIRDAIRDGKEPPQAPTRVPYNEDRLDRRAADYVPEYEYDFAYERVYHAIDRACTRPKDRDLVRFKEKGYTFPEMAKKLGVSEHQAGRALTRVWRAVCEDLEIPYRPIGRGRRRRR